ncbi:MAG: retropepsin-like aspartic protease [Cyanobacteriota bacterium]|nr:retropepsin-like aspartic protease [Cyanobacteriota bacterium]
MKQTAALLIGLVCLLVPCRVSGGGGGLDSARASIAALIHERGAPLAGGTVSGEADVALERAEGGDTPVLTLRSERGPVRLLLDTGAASAMVTPALAQRLGLRVRPLPKEALALAGGGDGCEMLQIASTELPDLSVSSLGGDSTPGASAGLMRLRGLQALVIPVGALPKGVDGVLGAPTWKAVPFVVDPWGNRLVLGPAALRWRPSRPGRSVSVIPLEWRRGVPLLKLSVHSDSAGRSVDALADTAAEGLFLHPDLAERLTPLAPPQPARLGGVCGIQAVVRQPFIGLGLDPSSAASQSAEAIITPNPVFSLLGIEAIVGQELLRHRQQRWRLEATPPRLEVW